MSEWASINVTCVFLQAVLDPPDRQGVVGGVCLALPYDAVEAIAGRVAAVRAYGRANGARGAVYVITCPGMHGPTLPHRHTPLNPTYVVATTYYYYNTNIICRVVCNVMQMMIVEL